MSDTLWINCHICGALIASRSVPDDHVLAPYEVIRWYERVIRHIRKEHLRKPRKSE